MLIADSAHLLQRFQLHDRRAVVVADPERDRCRAVVHEDAAHVRVGGQQVFDEA